MTGLKISALSPQRARVAIREQTFPNTQAEQTAVSVIDQAAFDRVRIHERLLIEDASQRISDNAAQMKASEELMDGMVTDLLHPLSRKADLTPEMSETFERYEYEIDRMAERLEVAADHAELLASRIDDPSGDFERIMDRFPALRKPLF